MKKILSFIICAAAVFCLMSVIAVNAANENNESDKIEFAYNAMQKYCTPEESGETYGYSEISASQLAELKAFAENAVKGCKTDYEKIEKLTLAIADDIYYDYDFYYGYSYETTLDAYSTFKSKRSVCQGYANLYLAMCNTLNIPCMMLHGSDHVYNAAYDSASHRWVVVDATWSSGNRYEYGQFTKGAVNRDHIDLSARRMYEITMHEMYMKFSFRVGDVYYGVSDNKTLYAAGACVKNKPEKLVIADTVEGRKVTGIEDRAFSGCSFLKEIVLPETLKTIGNEAFFECSSLTKVNVPDGVTEIGVGAFESCSSVKEATLGNNLKYIGMKAFQGCDSLESITIPFVGYKPNDQIGSFFGYIFGAQNSNESKTFVPSSLKTVVITGGNQISGKAFYGCSSVENIILPESIESIGDYAFYDCSSLKSISVPYGVTKIGAGTFYRCESLRSISFPGSVVSVGKDAFNRCKSLCEIYFCGTREEADRISVSSGNTAFSDASVKLHEFSEEWSYDRTCHWHECPICKGRSGTEDHIFENGECTVCHAAEVKVKKLELIYPEIKFTDSPATKWFYAAVKFATQTGIFKGYEDGTFLPSNSIQRQDFLVVLARYSGDDLTQYQGKKTSFKDVPVTSYYNASVAWGVENGITSGYSEDRFGVKDTVTREQFVTFFYRFAQKYGYDTVISENAKANAMKFSDFGKVSSYAVEAITWAVDKGVISGKSSDTIAPKDGCLRCEAAQIFYNIDSKEILKIA